MSPILLSVFAPIAKQLLGALINKLPISEGEKVKAQLEADKVLAEHAGTIAEAEASIATSRQAEWVADLTSNSWLAKNWRPLTGIASGWLILWEGMLVQVINTVMASFDAGILIPYAPDHVFDAATWVLLSLVGVRSFEKINAVRTVRK